MEYVWPLALIAVLALGTAIWKAVHLQRIHASTDRLMTRVNARAAEGQWQAAGALVDDRACRVSPVARVVRAGVDVRQESREIQDIDILRMYEIWLRTGSERAARRLREAGIEPNRRFGADTWH